MITASPQDGIYTNLNSGLEVDIDAEYRLSMIKNIVYDQDDKSFYICGNAYGENLGIYIVRIHENKPYSFDYLVKQKTKLEVDNVDFFILRGKQHEFKELIISYKTMYVNTLSLVVMDISDLKNFNIIFRHTSF